MIDNFPHRGIPPGYVSSIEQRLLKTEIALFEALSALDVPFDEKQSSKFQLSHRDVLSAYHAAQSKEAKMEEWKKLPLDYVEQRQSWQREKIRISRDSLNLEAGVVPILEALEPSSTTENWMGKLDSQQSARQTHHNSQPHAEIHRRIGILDNSSPSTRREDHNSHQSLVDKELVSNNLSQSQMVDLIASQHTVSQDLIHENSLDLDGQFDIGELVTQQPPHNIPPSSNLTADVMMDDNTSILQSTQDTTTSILNRSHRNKSLSTRDWHKYF